MTTDDQRWQALTHVRVLLSEIATGELRWYPELLGLRIPRVMRELARQRLKHYPEAWWIEQQQQRMTP